MYKIKHYVFREENIDYIQATEENLYVYVKDRLYPIPIANATIKDIHQFMKENDELSLGKANKRQEKMLREIFNMVYSDDDVNKKINNIRNILLGYKVE